MRPFQTRRLVLIDSEGLQGALGTVASALGKAGINIDGFSVTSNKISLMTDSAGEARNILEDLGMKVTTLDVVGIELMNRPGTLARLADVLHDAGVEIVHSFGIGHGDSGTIYVREDQIDVAAEQVGKMDGVVVPP